MPRLRAALFTLLSFLAAAYAQHQSSPTKTDPVIAKVFQQEIRMSQKNDLTSLIVRPLFEQYAAEHKIAATDEEIKTFVKRSREIDAQDHQEWEKQRQDTEN